MQSKLVLGNRPTFPSLLSMGGIILPVFFLVIAVQNWLAPPPLGIDAPVTVEPVLIGLVSSLSILPLLFSTLLLFQSSRHAIWGITLAAWHGAIITLGSVVITNLPGILTSINPLFLGLFLTPLLGLGGGLWAISWKPSGYSRS